MNTAIRSNKNYIPMAAFVLLTDSQTNLVASFCDANKEFNAILVQKILLISTAEFCNAEPCILTGRS